MAIVQHEPRTFQAFLLRFCDGDTCIVLLQSRFGAWVEKRLRLAGIESWELDSPDKLRAEAIRDKLDDLLSNKRCIVHLENFHHDAHGRMCGSIQVNGYDLGEQLVKQGFAWPATKQQSTAAHAAATTAAGVAAAVASGCTTTGPGGSLIQIIGTNSPTIYVATRAESTQPTHYLAWILGTLAVAGAVAGIVWLIHNRGKLVALAANVATKV